MIIAGVQKLKIEFGGREIFSDVTFDVNEGDFVGLIGANGTGKTSLFKAITGEVVPSAGGVFISKNINVGYLEQHACAGSVRTVYDEALTAFSDLIETEKKLEEISSQIENGADNVEELINNQSTLHDYYNRRDGLTYRSKTASALTGLGFSKDDFNLTCDKLSGGQRSKLSMCKLLLSGADLILLDEPTNHLDISGVEWLEDYLKSYKGSVIVISHDRYFLDKICNKIVELANKRSYFCKGNYSAYCKAKQQRIEIERRHYENQLEEIKRIEGIIEQQRSFARERNFITAESKRKMLEKKKAELVEPEPDIKQIRIKFDPAYESGSDVLSVERLKKSFGDKVLFENGSMKVYKGDRAVIIGKNGCGKSTLLKILTRKITPDEGLFSFGANTVVGYFDQNLESLRGGKTVIDEIWDENRRLKETEVRKYLALFLFRGDDVFKQVDSLSGGEKAKLCLLKLMLSQANVLLLDEPTNHLDIVSREVLENALMNYTGTIIAVSHDRYFINKLSTKLFRMTEYGFELFDGDYDDYCRVIAGESVAKAEKTAPKVNEYKLLKERNSEINRLKGKIKRTEAEIENVEATISSLNDLLSQPETAADYEKVCEITKETESASQKLLELMEEWEKMTERLTELTEDM